VKSEDPREDQVLRERAAALARGGGKVDVQRHTDAVSFVRAGRRYALDARACTGVAALAETVELGDLPAPLWGYAVFRGEPLALFDLAALFGGDVAGADEASPAPRHALVVGADRPRLGLLADRVEEVSALDEALFHAAGAPDPLLLGTHERLQVIDAERLVMDPRFLIDQSG
jgi:chemotaxis signal transduction protein